MWRHNDEIENRQRDSPTYWPWSANHKFAFGTYQKITISTPTPELRGSITQYSRGNYKIHYNLHSNLVENIHE